MTDPYEDISAVRELREGLRAAARRDMAPVVAPRRSWTSNRRGALAVGLGILLAAGAAGAAQLLSTGKPVPEPRGKASKYRPGGSGTPLVAVTARDPVGHATWAVAVYRSRAGQDCAIAGQLRGNAVGIFLNGRFHPYGTATSGPCDSLTRRSVFGDLRYFPALDRTVVYGRARAPVRGVTLTIGGRRVSARAGRGGAFLFLFVGKISSAGMRLSRR